MYNFQRLYKLKTETPQSTWLLWVEGKKEYLTKLTILATTIGLILMLLITSFKVNNFLLLSCLALIAIVYVVPIKGKSLREIAGLKIFLVALVWTGLTLVYPMLNANIPLQLYWKEISGFFLFFFAVTIPFDIRDLQFDLPMHKTIPQVLGINGAKVLAIGLILMFFTLTAKFNQEIWKSALLSGFCILTSFLILYTNPQRSTNYFAAIDAMMILLGLWFFV